MYLKIIISISFLFTFKCGFSQLDTAIFEGKDTIVFVWGEKFSRSQLWLDKNTKQFYQTFGEHLLVSEIMGSYFIDSNKLILTCVSNCQEKRTALPPFVVERVTDSKETTVLINNSSGEQISNYNNEFIKTDSSTILNIWHGEILICSYIVENDLSNYFQVIVPFSFSGFYSKDGVTGIINKDLNLELGAKTFNRVLLRYEQISPKQLKKLKRSKKLIDRANKRHRKKYGTDKYVNYNK